ncbi:MAG: hypothetical protein RML46_05185 [Anaerolineae bacterium]|nr:hypothetical protein [Anaerolineae bacterium]MDW8068288.1 hypothetical protein [Anaerolineae bacterium]
MFDALLRMILGEWVSRLLDFLKAHPDLVTTIFALWLGLFAAGRYQLWRIEQKTTELVLEMARDLIAQKPNMTAQGLYKRIYPRWAESLRRWAWFVPHRFELWPVPVRPDTVQQKIPFSPQWIAETLRRHGVSLAESPRSVR